MIRVLQIVPNMHAAGLETLIMNLYRNIDRTQIQFDFLTHYSGKYFYDDEIVSLGGHIYRLSFRDDNNLNKYLNDLDLFFKKHKYYIVHSHMSSTAIFTLKAAQKYGVPVRILHSHNTSTEKTLKGKLKYMLLRHSARYANYYFACGEEAGRYLFGNKPFVVIHNAIDLEKFRYAKLPEDDLINKLNLKNKFIIGHVGRFNTQKNHKFLLEVFEKTIITIPESVLLLVGEGELEAEIKNLVIQKKLENSVFFLGVRSDTEKLYKLFDVFLLPSLFEGLPVVGIECQASGVKTIISHKITKEVQITNYISMLPIDEGVECWVNRIKEIKNVYNIINSEEEHQKLIDSGYDIRTEANALLEKYQRLIKSTGE